MSSCHSFGKRTALVTGGSKNIGLSIARHFLDAGLNVAVLSSDSGNIENAINRLGPNNAVAGFVCDLTKIERFDEILSKVNNRFGSIDIVVNCAGILDLASIEDTKELMWDLVFDVNLKAPFFLVQKCLPYLKNASHPRVINISSNAGRMGGFVNGLSYSASKGGMIALTYGLARHLAKYGITVNCIAPGTIESDMSAARDEVSLKNLLSRFPLGRLGRSEEVASAALYFASIESGFTTGAVLDVNGGLFMG